MDKAPSYHSAPKSEHPRRKLQNNLPYHGYPQFVSASFTTFFFPLPPYRALIPCGQTSLFSPSTTSFLSSPAFSVCFHLYHIFHLNAFVTTEYLYIRFLAILACKQFAKPFFFFLLQTVFDFFSRNSLERKKSFKKIARILVFVIGFSRELMDAREPLFCICVYTCRPMLNEHHCSISKLIKSQLSV